MSDGAAGRGRGATSWRELAGVALLLLALGAAFTWPLAKHASTDVLYTSQAPAGGERVPIMQGDHLQLLYFFWLLGDSLREGHSLLEEPYQFRDGSPPGFFFQPSLLPLLTVLLSPLGLIGAYNALTLLSFPAAGLAAFLLLRRLVDDRWGALAGALVVALFPFRVAQLAGHANGFLAFLVPLYLYFLERLLTARRWAGWAAAAGIAFFFAGAMEFHIVYYLTLFLGLYLPYRLLTPLSHWLPVLPGEASRPRAAAPALAGVALGGAGAGIALYHAADRVHGFGQPAGWVVSAAAAAVLALALWRLLLGAALRHLPAPGAALTAAVARPFAAGVLLWFAPLGSGLGLPLFGRLLAAATLVGAAALAAPLVRAARGVRPLPQWSGHARNRLARHAVNLALVGCTLAFLVVVRARVFAPSTASGGRRLSEVSAYSPRPADLLGPGVRGAEREVYPGLAVVALALAGALALRRVEEPGRRATLGFLAVAGAAGFLLAVGPNLKAFPIYHVLFQSVPMFNFPRVAGRILLVGVVGLAALAALGVAALRARAGRGAALATAAALALIVADYRPRHAPGLTALPAATPVYDRLAADRAAGEVLLELPIWPGDSAWSSIYLWYATRYRQPMLNGYSPAVPRGYVERVFRPLYPLDFGELRRPQYELMRRLGVRHVVFHEEAYPIQVSEFPPSVALENLRRSPLLETVAAEPPLTLFRLREQAPSEVPAGGAVSPVGSLWEGETWMAAPGQRAADPLASGGAVAAFAAGPARTLSRSPTRRSYPTGTYRALARFVADGPAFPGLTLEVRRADTRAVLATARGGGSAAAGGVLDLEATYTLAEPGAVAIEIASDGSAPARWDFVLVRFADEPEPQLDVEVEALWHIGRPLADERASGGAAVELAPGRDPREIAFGGPDRILPAGAWVARLRFAAGPEAPDAGERFEVAVSNAPQPLAARALPAAAQDGFQEVELPFTLERSAPVRFRVFFAGARRLVLDRVSLARR